jgi:hypothetical protein
MGFVGMKGMGGMMGGDPDPNLKNLGLEFRSKLSPIAVTLIASPRPTAGSAPVGNGDQQDDRSALLAR